MANKSGIEQLQKIMHIAEENWDGSDCEEPLFSSTNTTQWIPYLYDCFGGFAATVSLAKTSLMASQRLFKNSPRYQKSVRVLNGAVPLCMTAYELYGKVKHRLRADAIQKKPFVDESLIVLSTVLELEESMKTFGGNHIKQKHLLEWIAEGRSAGTMVIEGILNEKWDIVDSVPDNASWTLYFIINIEGLRFGIKLNYNLILDTLKCFDIYTAESPAVVGMALMYAYINSLDYKNNVIVIDHNSYHYMNIRTRPRIKVEHNVYQLEDSFYNELKNSIKKKKKRGYTFVGQPGVGKTTIINKVIDEMRDVPVVTITADPSKSPNDIMSALIICQMISPCMVIIEDIDMLPLQHKDSKHLSTFIEYLDSSRYSAPVIFISTMNEPEMVNPALMDRRGRFDKVIVIGPPTTKEEIKEVMQNVYIREHAGIMPDVLCDEFYRLAINNELRHSDFTEILNRMIINDYEFTSENVLQILKDICNTQTIINKFKNRNNTKTIPITKIEALVKQCPHASPETLLNLLKNDDLDVKDDCTPEQIDCGAGGGF